MEIISILLFACLLILSQADHKIPVRVHRLRKDLDSKENDFIGTAPLPLPLKDSALVMDVLVDNKQFSVALDTLSNLLWLPSKDCQSTFCEKSKNRIPVTTKDKPMNGYNGKIRGYEVKNDLTLDYLTVPEINLLAADYVDVEVAKRLPSGVNGALGLMGADIFKHLMPDQNVISLYLNRKNPYESWCYFGESYPKGLTKKEAKLAKLNFITSDSKRYFKTSLNYISNNDEPWLTWSIGGADVLLDTTYSGITGPFKEIESINQYIGTDDDGYIDCTQVPYLLPLTFHIYGNTYNLDPKNYIKRGEKKFDVRCKSVFEPHYSTRNIWKLGVAFMHQHLTLFKRDGDTVKVAFVELK